MEEARIVSLPKKKTETGTERAVNVQKNGATALEKDTVIRTRNASDRDQANANVLMARHHLQSTRTAHATIDPNLTLALLRLPPARLAQIHVTDRTGSPRGARHMTRKAWRVRSAVKAQMRLQMQPARPSARGLMTQQKPNPGQFLSRILHALARL